MDVVSDYEVSEYHVDDNDDNNDSIMLETRMKPKRDGETSVRIWDSTYETLIGIQAKMMLSSREPTSIPQVIDALARAVEKTKITVEQEDD